MRRLLLLVTAAACSGPAEPAAPAVRDRPPLPAASKPVASSPSSSAAPEPPFVGVITAAESADVVAPFAGVLAAVHVRPGDRVSPGQTVAELAPGSVEEELRAAEAAAGRAAADVRKARVDVADAHRKLALQRRAAAAGLSPAAAIEEARLALERARAAEQGALHDASLVQSRANTARGHLADTRLRAPFEGTVALRFRDAGSTVQAGAPIAKIVRRGQLRLRFAVPPHQASLLRPGTVVTARVEMIASPIAATVRHVSPALDPASEHILVEAEIAAGPDIAAELRPGLAADVTPRASAER